MHKLVRASHREPDGMFSQCPCLKEPVHINVKRQRKLEAAGGLNGMLVIIFGVQQNLFKEIVNNFVPSELDKVNLFYAFKKFCAERSQFGFSIHGIFLFLFLFIY